jgi:hypothetical protein
MVDVTIRSAVNTVGACTPRRRKDLELPADGIDAPEIACLPGKPQDPLVIEGGGIQVGIRRSRGQGKTLHHAGVLVNPHDRIMECQVNIRASEGTPQVRRLSGKQAFFDDWDVVLLLIPGNFAGFSDASCKKNPTWQPGSAGQCYRPS